MFWSPNFSPPEGGGFENLSQFTPQRLVTFGVNFILILAVIIFFFLLVFGGIKWISSGGDKMKVEDAKKTVTNALIGLLIVFAVFAIILMIEAIFRVEILRLQTPFESQDHGNTILPMPTSTPALVPPTLNPSVPSPTGTVAGCVNSGGAWEWFPDTCVDNCGPREGCLEAITYSCNCNSTPTDCWTGTVCSEGGSGGILPEVPSVN